MGVAKRIVPNSMWLITRRVMWREWRLRPSKKLNKIFSFVVFKVAAELGIKISAVCVMSNHWHAVVSASKRNLPLFMQKVHSELARAINAAHGDFGCLWDGSDDNYRLLETDEDVVRAISYTMNNPVAPGGVRHGKSWPGIRVAWPAKERVLERAKPFYRTEEAGGQTPPTVARVLSRPLRFDDADDNELEQRIARACQEGEDKRAAEVLAAGGTFRRRADIRRLSRYQRSTSRELHFEAKRHVVDGDPKRRKARVQQRLEHKTAYLAALAAWRVGDRSVVFPYGTYKMVVLHGANMAPPPT